MFVKGIWHSYPYIVGWSMVATALTIIGGVIEHLRYTEIAVLVFAVCVLILVAANAVWSYRFKSQWIKRSSGQYRKFEQDWDGCAAMRKSLRERTRSAYTRWDEKPPAFDEVEVLAKKAGCPGGLALRNEDITHYARRAMESWVDGPRKMLLRFCVALYSKQSNSLPLDREEQGKLDEARKHLSKFWDRWGREGLFYNTIDINKLPELIPGQASQILLLVYLELGQAYWDLDEGPGKRWLFKLGEMVSKDDDL